jgi:hypothetical protein
MPHQNRKEILKFQQGIFVQAFSPRIFLQVESRMVAKWFREFTCMIPTVQTGPHDCWIQTCLRMQTAYNHILPRTLIKRIGILLPLQSTRI